jgi:hypothetical protein
MHCTKRDVDIAIRHRHVAKKLQKSVVISIFATENQTNTISDKSW